MLPLLLAAACSLPASDTFGPVPRPDPTHFRLCNNGEPEYIDPALMTSTTDLRIGYTLFDGLTVHDPKGLPSPSLATRWEVSPDQRRFRFHLRDDARWSNGRRLDANDFVYGVARVLHPATASARAETIWKIRNADKYTAGTVKLVLRDAPPFAAGDVVEVLPEPGEGGKAIPPPDSNARRARARLGLRLAPDEAAPPHRHVAAGAALTIVELGGPGRAWAWVHFAEGDGAYGWVPQGALDAPHADRVYRVRRLRAPFADGDADPPATEGSLRGADLLMLPETLGVRALDPLTVEFETYGPTPYFLDLTLQAALRPTPREAVAQRPRRWTRPEHIVTSGAFHLTFWRQLDRFELVKSPTYWGAADVRLDRLTIYSMNDRAASAAYYYSGGCDAVVSNNIPSSWLPVLDGTRGPGPRRRDYIREPFLGVYFYLINVERFDNVHLRRALSHALDRTMLPAILKGGEIPTEQYTPGTENSRLSDEELALCGVTRDTPGVSLIVEKGRLCYRPPPGAGFDPAAARAELELARREMGDRFPRVITVRFNTGVESHKHIAEWVQHEWKRHLGLDVQLESQEWKTFLKSTREREYDVARMGWIGNFPDPEAEFLRIFRCKSPDNRSGFCNDEFERLYAAAEQEPDRGRRLELMRQAEAILMSEMPVLPLYVYTQHHLQRPYVRGLDVNLVDQPVLKRVWIDPEAR